jgi:hypothetical protein
LSRRLKFSEPIGEKSEWRGSHAPLDRDFFFKTSDAQQSKVIRQDVPEQRSTKERQELPETVVSVRLLEFGVFFGPTQTVHLQQCFGLLGERFYEGGISIFEPCI